MNIIPILKCKDINKSILFYTQVLDFENLYPDDAFPYRLLTREGARLDISTEDGVFGACVYIQVGNVDELFKKFVARGLDLSAKTGVHGQPTNQTWGMREFYVEDPDGNTLRFGHEIK
jgi:catechol 2,3-dioxygenase-like lactoylglutathione lyase family enzyme